MDNLLLHGNNVKLSVTIYNDNVGNEVTFFNETWTDKWHVRFH